MRIFYSNVNAPFNKIKIDISLIEAAALPIHRVRLSGRKCSEQMNEVHDLYFEGNALTLQYLHGGKFKNGCMPV